MQKPKFEILLFKKKEILQKYPENISILKTIFQKLYQNSPNPVSLSTDSHSTFLLPQMEENKYKINK